MSPLMWMWRDCPGQCVPMSDRQTWSTAMTTTSDPDLPPRPLTSNQAWRSTALEMCTLFSEPNYPSKTMCTQEPLAVARWCPLVWEGKLLSPTRLSLAPGVRHETPCRSLLVSLRRGKGRPNLTRWGQDGWVGSPDTRTISRVFTSHTYLQAGGQNQGCSAWTLRLHGLLYCQPPQPITASCVHNSHCTLP